MTELLKQNSDDFGKLKFSGTCLVAEDVIVNQTVIKRMLEKAGITVTIANDGKEAVQQVQSQTFDLVFMDIQMPNMNGYAATKALRKAGITTPIVALTASTMKGDDKQCLEAGCDDYLSKPIDRKNLFVILAKYLSPTAKVEGDFMIEKLNAIGNGIDELSEMCTGQSHLDEQLAKSLTVQNNREVIDWADLACRRVGAEVLEEVIPVFLTENKEIIDKLAAAIDAGDAKEINSYAHAIKGGAGNVGAMKLSKVASELEHMACQEDLSNTGELLERIKTEFQKFGSFVSMPDWIEIAKQQANSEKAKQLS